MRDSVELRYFRRLSQRNLRARWGRLLNCAVAIACVAQAHATPPRRDRTITGDVIKASRFLNSARLDDARTLLADLGKRAPDSPEVKWLSAEVKFQTGDYAGALALIDKLPDTA